MMLDFVLLCRTVKPLLSAEDFQKTTQIVKKFGTESGIGPKLQNLLENKANSMDNWVSLYNAYVFIYNVSMKYDSRISNDYKN